MADSLKQFYANSNISYTDLTGTGLTIASTNGSQKAVIKDIDIDNPNSKNLKASIDGVTIGNITQTETLYGNVILDNSKEIKLSSAAKPVWTSIRSNKNANTIYHNINEIKDDYFTIPGDTFNLGSEKDEKHTSGGLNLNSEESTIQGDVTFWFADQMFNKPAGDMYYMSGWRDSNSNNKLNYWDASAESASNLVAASSSYLQWKSGYSNKYLIRIQNSTNPGQLQVFDTTNHTLSTVTTKRTSSTDDDFINGMDGGKSMFTIFDKYAFARRDPSNSSQRDCALIDVTTGRKISWLQGTSWTESYKRMGNSYHDYYAVPQMVKNSGGNYYMLWMTVEGSGSGGHGLQIIDWSTDPSAIIEGNTNTYYSTSQMSSKTPTVAKFDSSTTGLTGITWYHWRNYDSTANFKGWGTGWCPLTKLSPTNSYSRYWMYANTEFMLLIDVDNITETPKKIQVKVGGSTSDSFISGSNAAYEAFTWTPYVNDAKIASGFGTIKCRTSGILET